MSDHTNIKNNNNNPPVSDKQIKTSTNVTSGSEDQVSSDFGSGESPALAQTHTAQASDFSLSDLVKKQQKPTTTQLAGLASLQASNVGAITTTPAVPMALSLAQLAKQHSSSPPCQTGVSLADLAKHSPPCQTGVSLADLAKHSPPCKTGVSLADFAKHSPPCKTGVSLADLAKHIPPCKTGVSLADLAKQHSSSPPIQTGLSLAEMAKQHQQKTASKPVPAGKIQGFSLAAFATHSNKESTSGTNSGTAESNQPNHQNQGSSLSRLAAKHTTESKQPDHQNQGSSLSRLAAKDTAESKQPNHQNQCSSFSQLAAKDTAESKQPNHQNQGFSLSQLAAKHTETSQHISKSKSGPPPSMSHNLPVFNLAHLAAQHKDRQPPICSVAEITADHKSDTGHKSTKPPPGHTCLSEMDAQNQNVKPVKPPMIMCDLSQLAAQHDNRQSVKPPPGLSGLAAALGRSPPPPGFQPKLPVDLTQLAAQHRPTTAKVSGATSIPQSTESNESTRHISSEQAVVREPSVFGQALCARFKPSRPPPTSPHTDHPPNRSIAHHKFSYRQQISRDLERQYSGQTEIDPFDFSTPSPDDIVKTKQKAAFTREGMSDAYPFDFSCMVEIEVDNVYIITKL